jgi:hypothetical protein
MKSIMTAVLLTAAIASPVLAQAQVPFRGTVEGVDSGSGGAFPVFLRSLSGTGHASHLGQFTMTAEWQVNVLTDPAEGVGSFTLTAANGDTLFGTSTGPGIVVDGIAYIQETHTITGGTGRFAGATGTFAAGRVLVEATGIYASSFDGIIDLHH